MNVTIINIGDELLIGQVVNTNASTMSRMLTEAGMTTAVSDVHPSKAPFTISYMLLGITVFLQPAINQFVSVCMMALQPLRES